MPSNFPIILIFLSFTCFFIMLSFFLIKANRKNRNENIEMTTSNNVKKKNLIYSGSFFQDRMKSIKKDGLTSYEYDRKVDECIEKIKPEFDRVLNRFLKDCVKNNNYQNQNGFYVQNIRGFVKEIDLITLLDHDERNIRNFVISYNATRNLLECSKS